MRKILSINGTKKAAVFPVPVWAQPNTSFPSRIGGIACTWIGVGTEYPFVCKARNIGSIKFNFSNAELLKIKKTRGVIYFIYIINKLYKKNRCFKYFK